MWVVVKKYGPFLGTLNIGIMGTILGFYGDNGKENGNQYIGVIYTLVIPFGYPRYYRCRIIIGNQNHNF